MKASLFFNSLRYVAGVAACLPLLSTAQAQINGSWVGANNTSWGASSSWLGSPNPVPGGAGSTIYLTNASNRNITLDGDRVVGILNYKFTANSNIQTGTGGVLIFDNGVNKAQLNYGSGAGLAIPASVQLNSSLDISTAADTGNTYRFWTGAVTAGGSDSAKVIAYTAASGGSGRLDFAGVISDGASNRKVSIHMNAANGYLQLRGANTFSGGVRVSAGTLYLAGSGINVNALGSGTLTLDGGTLAVRHTTSLAFANQVNIAADSAISIQKGGNAAGITGSFGALSVGGHVVTVNNVDSLSSTSPDTLVFGATTLTGNATFSVNTGAAVAMTLQLGALNGAYSLTKSGDGFMDLNTAAGTYSGTTRVNQGTLRVGNNAALGSGGAVLGGSAAATLQINSGITVGNTITYSNTHASSSVNRLVAANAGFDTGSTGGLRSDLAEGINTMASFRASTVSSGTGTLSMRFAAASLAENDEGRVSDVFNVAYSGTLGRTFVLQLSTGLTAPEGTYLGWLDEGLWKLATDGIEGGVLAGEYNQSWSSFLATHGGAFNATTMLGAYGYDLDSGTAWAVTNRMGGYALISPIPEPSTWGLIGLGAGYLVLRRRRSAVGLG